MDNLISVMVESVPDLGRMIAANCIIFKVFQVDFRDIDILFV